MESAFLMKTIILGPPGTGKTTTLLDLVEDFLRAGTDIKKMGIFLFTKKAAWEATHRAEQKFMIDHKDIPYFRTLHSLAFRMLGAKKEACHGSCRLQRLWFKMWHTYQDSLVQ